MARLCRSLPITSSASPTIPWPAGASDCDFEALGYPEPSMLLAQILLNGVLLGGLYGLMALGMALVWGVLNIVNLAHGALIMLGGYAVYFLYTGAGIDPFLALPLAMLALFVF